MPLYNYECKKCECVIELFMHSYDSEPTIKCETCGENEFVRVLGIVHNKVRLNAKDTLKDIITPEVERIMGKVSGGDDRNFLDIAGD